MQNWDFHQIWIVGEKLFVKQISETFWCYSFYSILVIDKIHMSAKSKASCVQLQNEPSPLWQLMPWLLAVPRHQWQCVQKESTGPFFQVKISSAWAISMLRNGIKCTFILFLTIFKNKTKQELTGARASAIQFKPIQKWQHLQQQ